MMKILVTGASGQLGRELKRVLEVELPEMTTYVDINELDLRDAEATERFIIKNDFSHIINCAAYTDVERAETDKKLCREVNVDAVRNIANAAHQIDSRVIHISTDYVFDGTNFRPYKESDKPNPVSEYGSSKREGETALMAHAPESIIIRTAWLYSPHGKNFVKTMLRLGNERDTINVVNDQIGSPTYAADLAKAIINILRAPKWCPGIYHFTNSGVASWYDLAKAVHRLSDQKKCVVNPIASEKYPSNVRRPYYSVLDCTKICDTFNLKIPHWEEALSDCLGRIMSEKQ